jgi:hypothetical protein
MWAVAMRNLRIGAVAGTLSLVLGCGAVGGPETRQTTPARPDGSGASGGQGSTGGGSGQGTGPGSGGGGQEYPWSLPGGDPGLTVAVGTIYMAIRAGECDRAQTMYDANSGNTLSDEGDKTLLRVGIALCRGDRATALNEFATYEWPGYGDNWFQCQLYAAAGSVLRHRPRSSFADCPSVQPGTGTTDPPSPEVSPDAPPTEESPPVTDEPSPTAEPS